jgi:hypothetical protein
MQATRATILSLALCGLLLAGCAADRKPQEITPDGLVRVPSRASGGVFRAPGAPFTQYKRLIVEPLTVAFVSGWESQHKDVSAKEVKRMRDEAARGFREEFDRVLIDEGPYTFADEPATDVLIVNPALTELDVPGPESDRGGDKQTLAPRSVSLRITGELRDAATGKLVGRIDMFSGGEPYGIGAAELRPTNRVTNAHEMRLAFQKWSRLLREALAVAQVGRPQNEEGGLAPPPPLEPSRPPASETPTSEPR